MKFSRFLSILLLSLGTLVVASFSTSIISTVRSNNEVDQLATLSQSQTLWLNGTIDLSLERSVTQVSLALEDPVPDAFRAIIERQRELSNASLERAVDLLGGFQNAPGYDIFMREWRTKAETIRNLRSEVDQMLQVPLSDRDGSRAKAIPLELKATISHLNNMTELVSVESSSKSNLSSAFLAIQKRAWEIREYGGRARTYYAIATLTKKPVSEADQLAIAMDSQRALSAWVSLEGLARTNSLNRDFLAELERAGKIYFQDYKSVTDQLDSVIAQGSTDYPIGFEEFFETSSAALNAIVLLSHSAGDQTVAYWTDRANRAQRQLTIQAIGIMVLVASLFAVYILVSRGVSQRLSETAQALVDVAEGDLDRPATKNRFDLSEIVVLTDSLNRLKDKLRDARLAEAERVEQQALQREVVEELSLGLANLADGNTRHRITREFGSGYDVLCENFNSSCEKLSEVISSVVQSAQSITAGSAELSASSNDLSHRTESQAASLETTASALNTLGESVAATAQRSEQANEHATNARHSAATSGQVVTDAIEIMGEIKASSDKIASAISLIEDIAFQTNLLALNASVEASRAGDAGSGFAVVASEVRGLANRAADSAKEIKALIDVSGAQVDRGVELVGRTGTSLQSIVTTIETVSDLVSEISQASSDQSERLSEMNGTVKDLDHMAQKNAAMAEESSAASQLLSQDAHELRLATQVFASDDDAPHNNSAAAA